MQKLTNFFLERIVGEVSNVIPSIKKQRTKNPIPPNGRLGGGVFCGGLEDILVEQVVVVGTVHHVIVVFFCWG